MSLPQKPPHLATFAPDAQVSATFQTSAGEFVCRLFAKECPITVGNFVALARGEMPTQDPRKLAEGTPFYDGTLFHRVIPEFMVQGGDPTGTGSGGPGYQFSDEIVHGLSHSRPGMLSMANAGPGTNGSQFFITEVATPWLDGKHTVFGEVTQGFEIVQQIGHCPRGAQDRPKQDVRLTRLLIAVG